MPPPADKPTRERLMAAMMEVVAREGFHAATTAAIAKAAGVAEGTIYRHFRGKDELAVAAFRKVKGATYAAAIEGYDESASPGERFRHLWTAIFTSYRSRADEWRFSSAFLESPFAKLEGGEAAEVIQTTIGRLARDGVKLGEVKDLPADLMFNLFFAPLRALLHAELVGGRVWSDDEVAQAATASWDAWRTH